MSKLKEFFISFIIICILIVFLNPTHLLMPESAHAMLSLGLIVFFLMFIAMVWNEKAADEREALHIQIAGRLSFLTGASILLAGILVQTVQHSVDQWLLLALIGMVLTKVLSRLYHSFKN